MDDDGTSMMSSLSSDHRLTRKRAIGFTLLEIVVALLLMGSLAAATLVALAAQQHQVLVAKQKQEATSIAESLLSQWYDRNGSVPSHGQGIVEQRTDWLWRTQPIRSESIFGLPVNIIRLEVIGAAGRRRQLQVLAFIDVVQSDISAGGA
jgi:prepilin-type N-terminal cleavage/methylation domain-containing protein